MALPGMDDRPQPMRREFDLEMAIIGAERVREQGLNAGNCRERESRQSFWWAGFCRTGSRDQVVQLVGLYGDGVLGRAWIREVRTRPGGDADCDDSVFGRPSLYRDYGKRCALNSPLQDVSAKWLSPSTSDLQRINSGWLGSAAPDPETKSFNWSVCTVTGFLVGLGSGSFPRSGLAALAPPCRGLLGLRLYGVDQECETLPSYPSSTQRIMIAAASNATEQKMKRSSPPDHTGLVGRRSIPHPQTLLSLCIRQPNARPHSLNPLRRTIRGLDRARRKLVVH
ncbi:hypothetical protein R3P38DRAFT_3350072 [Favolaschia claudopus]|uniref:Uncharacterized protein n=1 Tax=Favolaschia claudopus TaxID=2862362 RepID=A0AAW0CHL9_9AGAR